MTALEKETEKVHYSSTLYGNVEVPDVAVLPGPRIDCRPERRGI
jgi:hypothetical protein